MYKESDINNLMHCNSIPEDFTIQIFYNIEKKYITTRHSSEISYKYFQQEIINIEQYAHGNSTCLRQTYRIEQYNVIGKAFEEILYSSF